jgi:ankyrin repeat protein
MTIMTPAVHYAAASGRVDVLKLLISAGANFDAKTNEHMTAGHFAARKGHVDLLKLLLSEGADLLIKTTQEG